MPFSAKKNKQQKKKEAAKAHQIAATTTAVLISTSKATKPANKDKPKPSSCAENCPVNSKSNENGDLKEGNFDYFRSEIENQSLRIALLEEKLEINRNFNDLNNTKESENRVSVPRRLLEFLIGVITLYCTIESVLMLGLMFVEEGEENNYRYVSKFSAIFNYLELFK
ncbi:uncharacterized protein LOC135841421 [Planococcus citri]|uniref:uncharacterized protein LOC135841421 n=1 Tax=Planococcus citri TaxID=170843 RepID=UPI0031FA0588